MLKKSLTGKRTLSSRNPRHFQKWTGFEKFVKNREKLSKIRFLTLFENLADLEKFDFCIFDDFLKGLWIDSIGKMVILTIFRSKNMINFDHIFTENSPFFDHFRRGVFLRPVAVFIGCVDPKGSKKQLKFNSKKCIQNEVKKWLFLAPVRVSIGSK